MKSRKEVLKQTLILAIAKRTALIVTVSVPHIACAMPIHMIKAAFYPNIIQFDEETIQLMKVTYKTKVFYPYKHVVLIVGHRQIV